MLFIEVLTFAIRFENRPANRLRCSLAQPTTTHDVRSRGAVELPPRLPTHWNMAAKRINGVMRKLDL